MKRVTAVGLLVIACSSVTQAEVILEGSTSPLTGPTFELTENLGTLRGNSLIHTFQAFSIGADETANFTHTTAAIRHIIARVRGVSPSNIDGTLTADANLWLLNPNGVIVGDTASIDVAGQFRFNTEVAGADELGVILEDGSLLTADRNLNTLTVANPMDFGFFGSFGQPQVTIDDTLTGSGLTITATDVGGVDEYAIDVGSPTIGLSDGQNAYVSFGRFSVFANQRARFFTSAGNPLDNIIARVTGTDPTYLAGEVITSGTELDSTALWLLNPAGVLLGSEASFDVGGTLALSAASTLAFANGAVFDQTTTGVQALSGSNPVAFADLQDGGSLELIGTSINEALMTRDIGDLILAGGDVVLDNALLRTEGRAAQPAGDIVLNADQLAIHASDVRTTTSSDTRAGDLVVSVDDLLLTDAAFLGSFSGSPGATGDVHIDVANNLTVRAHPDAFTRSTISTDTASAGINNPNVGATGDIDISVGGDVNAEDINVLTLPTSTTSIDTAPDIRINAEGNVALTNASIISVSRGGGDSGDVSIFGQRLDLFDATVTATTEQAGNAGDVSLTALESVTVDGTVPDNQVGATLISSSSRTSNSGASGDVTISAPVLDLNNAEIVSETRTNRVVTNSAGEEITGNIRIVGEQSIRLSNSAAVATSHGSSRAGNVSITGGDVTVSGQRVAQSRSFGSLGDVVGRGIDVSANAQGDAGSITLIADNLHFADAAFVSASTAGSGHAGDIQIEARGNLTAGRTDTALERSLIASVANARPRDPVVGGSGSISVDVGGDIDINALNIIAIPTSSRPGFAPSNIDIRAGGDITTHTSGVAAVSRGSTNGGDINITGRNLDFFDTGITAAAEQPGNAGNISITASEQLRVDGSPQTGIVGLAVISSSSRSDNAGAAGDVELTARTIDINNTELVSETRSNRIVADENGEIVGDIVINATEGVTLTNSAVVATSFGAASAGNVEINSGDLEIRGRRSAQSRSFGSLGDIVGNGIDVSANAGGSAGSILINSDNLHIADAALVSSSTSGAGNAGSININVNGDLLATRSDAALERSLIASSAQTSPNDPVVGSSGDVAIDVSGNIRTDGFNVVAIPTATRDGLAPSNITITAGGNVDMTTSGVAAVTRGSTNGGDILISGRALDLFNTGITAATEQGGNAGSITLVATDSVSIDGVSTGEPVDLAVVSSSSRSDRSGAAGDITIRAPFIEISNAEIVSETRTNQIVFEEVQGVQISQTGQATERVGRIVIDADALLTINNSAVVATSLGASAGGRISLSANRVIITGDKIARSRSFGSLADPVGQGIEVSAAGAGAAGDIEIDADAIEMTATRVAASTTAGGAAGSIRVNGRSTTDIQGSEVLSTTASASSGGAIELVGQNINVGSASVINASTTSSGRAGSIFFDAGQTVVLSENSVAQSQSNAAGDGGQIVVRTGDLQLSSGGRIETNAEDTGLAGAIFVDAARNVFITSNESTPNNAQSGLFTNSTQSAGGNIDVQVGNRLQMVNGQIVSSVASLSGDGGDVGVTASSLVLQKSVLLAGASAGAGGGIQLTRGQNAGVFLIDGNSVINADSQSGVDGQINVESPDTDLAGNIRVPDATLGSDQTLVPDPCQTARSELSTFTVASTTPARVRLDDYVPLPRKKAPESSDRGASAQGCVR